MVSASNIPKYLCISFSASVLLLSWFGSSIPHVRCRLPHFITSMTHFSMPNSIPMSWLYILTAYIRVSCSFSLPVLVFPILYYYYFKRFHTSVNWWFTTGVWVTTSLLKSPGLFSVFWSILIVRLGDFYLSIYLQVLESLYQSFDDCTDRINYNWYHSHFHVPLFFSVL